jgi:ribosomal-protein-alanine N-acetyltransferase
MPGLRSAPDAVHTLRLGRGRARLGPWSVDPSYARLVASPDAPLDTAAVHGCVDRARALGYRGLLTSALTDAETPPFLACEFVVHERLHLLAARLVAAPPPPALPITRVRRREHRDVLAIDAAAFPRAWQLGGGGLVDALHATPGRQFRAARADTTMTGYAITGLAGSHGYLQRIATRPAYRRAGIGSALVLDALGYLWKRGASRAFVNTQLDNAAALSLYGSCGFELLPSGLTVLERSW